MSDLQLVIGDKNRCPWSLRAWLILKQLGLGFAEIPIPLGRPDTPERILRHSPSGRLPVLLAGEIRVWDSLAIAEFLADHFPSLWPNGAAPRALARSISAEMHSGFRELQTFLPMDFTAHFSPPGRLLTPVAASVRRVTDIWSTCRTGYGADGPFLFGEFTIADAMFAPICAAFTTHAIGLDELSQAYVEHIMGLPAMLEWAEGARAEAGPKPAIVQPVERPPLAKEPEPEPEPITAPPAPLKPPLRGGPLAASLRVPPPPPSPVPPPPPPARPPEPLTEVLAEDDEDEDLTPPAPGLPGVVPTRPYDTPEEEQPPAGPSRRLVRPPVTTGLFRWRQPRAVERPTEEPEPRHPDVTPTPETGPRPPLPTRPILTPKAPPAPHLSPRPPPSVEPPAALPPAPAVAEPTPEPARAAPAAPPSPPPPPPPPESPAQPEAAMLIAPRSVLRPATIKPIGDGIRRRR